MSRKKLTLSVEERLTRRAKAIAQKRGTSVSRLVETFFTALEEGEEEGRSARSGQGRAPEDPGGEGEFSDWAKQWRGAFAQEGETYPDDPNWEEEILREELEKKHAPQ